MRLDYTYSVKKRKIVIELATKDFTTAETMALDMLGEPLIEFQQTYPGDFTVSISKRLRSEFKIRVKIDGTQNIDLANEAGNQFLLDIQEVLHDKMEKLMEDYEDQIFPPKRNSVLITSY